MEISLNKSEFINAMIDFKTELEGCLNISIRDREVEDIRKDYIGRFSKERFKEYLVKKTALHITFKYIRIRIASESENLVKPKFNQEGIRNWNELSKNYRKAWNEDFCHRASYTLLNKILFIRICEDKGFMRNPEDYIAGEIKDPHIEEKLSKRGLQKWASIISNSTFGELINFVFLDMKKSYNNIVLYKDNKYEILNPTDEELNLKYLDGDKNTKGFVLKFEKVLSSIIEKLDTERFNFAKTDSNILGDVYEQFMDRETRKAIGQFYIPEFVIEYILKNTVLEVDIIENPLVTVADISCRSGHFLI